MAYVGLSQANHPCPYGSDGVNQLYFDPLQVVWLYDDFTASIGNGQLGWGNNQATSNGQGNATSSNPGVVYQQVGGAYNAGNYYLSKTYLLGGGIIVQNWVAGVNTLSNGNNRYQIDYGFMDALGDSSPGNNAVCFEYTDNVNSGQWVCKCISSGTATSVNTSVAATTAFQRFTIAINAAASNVLFYIGGTQVASISTNIPSVAMYIVANIQNTGTFSSGNNGYNLDMFSHYQMLTTSR